MIEAPIVHGSVSVSALDANVVKFSNESMIISVDDEVNSSRSNCALTNRASTNAINNISKPVASYFFVEMKMYEDEFSDTIGAVPFSHTCILSDVTSVVNEKVVIQISGLYSIVSNSESKVMGNVLDFSIFKNTESIARTLSKTKLNMNVVSLLSVGDEIYLNNNSGTNASSSLFINLLKSSEVY